MTAKRIHPKTPRPGARPAPRIRCSHKVWVTGDHDERWRRQRYGNADWDVCTFPATVEIDGSAYCNRHGGEVALAKLLGEDVEP